MRFLVLPIAAALLTGGSVAVQPTPRPVVILVHGRGHLETDSAWLLREWKRDLDSALGSVGLPRLASEDVRLAWYADVLDPEFTSPCTSRETQSDSLDLDSIVRDLVGSLASALPRNESRGGGARALIGDLLYVMDWAKQCAAERRVGSVIETAAAEGRPVIVVAYSLGSLVTYGYLSSAPPAAKRLADLRLVTIGSPLGNREIREVLGQRADSLDLPPGVSSWENIYDPDDVFAAPLEGLARPRTVRDRVTRSTSIGNAHHISRYLRDGATGAAIGRAICATPATPATPATLQGTIIEACKRL